MVFLNCCLCGVIVDRLVCYERLFTMGCTPQLLSITFPATGGLLGGWMDGGVRDTTQSPNRSFFTLKYLDRGSGTRDASTPNLRQICRLPFSLACAHIYCILYLRVFLLPLRGCGVSAGLSSSSPAVNTRPYVTSCLLLSRRSPSAGLFQSCEYCNERFPECLTTTTHLPLRDGATEADRHGS